LSFLFLSRRGSHVIASFASRAVGKNKIENITFWEKTVRCVLDTAFFMCYTNFDPKQAEGELRYV